MRSLIVLLVLLAATPAAALDFGIAGGVDLQGEFDLDAIEQVETDGDADTGYTLGLELTQDVGPVLELGLGGEYLFDRGLDLGEVDADARFVTLFALARVQALGPNVPLYLAGRVGYSDLALSDLGAGLDESGGLHWAVGIGVNLLDKLKAEALWANFKAELESGLDDADLDYQTIALRVIFSP